MDEAIKESRKLEKAIAQRIRQWRLDNGWTLEQLAKVTGLSKSYLSQLENCEKNPPITTLAKIAFGFGKNVTTLISGEEPSNIQNKFTLVRAAERRPIIHRNSSVGFSYEAVTFGKQDRIMDGYVITLGPEPPHEPLVHEGQEFAFVLEGRLEFVYDGESYTVEAGDSFYFDSDRPHSSRSLDNRPAKVLVVFSNPNR